jgi:hypothetical protein
MSSDGRWAYTLYSAKEPFVHALDTAGRTAKCIDLPQLADTDLSGTKLRLDGDTLRVGDLAAIDTRTFVVGEPRPRPAPRRAAAPAPAGDGTPAWPFVALGLVALGAVTLIVRRGKAAAV